MSAHPQASCGMGALALDAERDARGEMETAVWSGRRWRPHETGVAAHGRRAREWCGHGAGRARGEDAGRAIIFQTLRISMGQTQWGWAQNISPHISQILALSRNKIATTLQLTPGHPEDAQVYQAYRPRLGKNDMTGWIDIVNIVSALILWPAFDSRTYGDGFPLVEIELQQVVRKMYHDWKAWFASTHRGQLDGQDIDWHDKVFDDALLHLANVMVRYHSEVLYGNGKGPDIILRQRNVKVVAVVVETLQSVSEELGEQLTDLLDEKEPDDPHFFVYKALLSTDVVVNCALTAFRQFLDARAATFGEALPRLV
ncbi:hypothetical protein B0H14DRAFT_3481274 [Mycena olivaceomarginata]|nr:hypothetical protein B0H14DRAFT_3481274 [Mycena olivaceomarginata]